MPLDVTTHAQKKKKKLKMADSGGAGPSCSQSDTDRVRGLYDFQFTIVYEHMWNILEAFIEPGNVRSMQTMELKFLPEKISEPHGCSKINVLL